jgi:hypothetical protein
VKTSALRWLATVIALSLLMATPAVAAGQHQFREDNGTETTTYIAIGAQPRTEDDLKAAIQARDHAYGPGLNSGGPRNFKACLRAQGWRDAYTLRDGEYPDTDPDESGMVCHDIVFLGIVGSSCSNH